MGRQKNTDLKVLGWGAFLAPLLGAVIMMVVANPLEMGVVFFVILAAVAIIGVFFLLIGIIFHISGGG